MRLRGGPEPPSKRRGRTRDFHECRPRSNSRRHGSTAQAVARMMASAGTPRHACRPGSMWRSAANAPEATLSAPITHSTPTAARNHGSFTDPSNDRQAAHTVDQPGSNPGSWTLIGNPRADSHKGGIAAKANCLIADYVFRNHVSSISLWRSQVTDRFAIRDVRRVAR